MVVRDVGLPLELGIRRGLTSPRAYDLTSLAGRCWMNIVIVNGYNE
jgi:hypothetical protein